MQHIRHWAQAVNKVGSALMETYIQEYGQVLDSEGNSKEMNESFLLP